MIKAKLLIENVIVHSGYQAQYYEESKKNPNTLNEILSKHISVAYVIDDKLEAFLLWLKKNKADPKTEIINLLRSRYASSN